jgi:hypothetical protein
MEEHAERQAWNDAAAGLDTLRTGVVLRLVVMLAAFVYTIALFSSKGMGGGPGGFALLLGVGELIATIVALAGALRFAARLPRHVQTAAGLAGLCLIVVLLCQLYGLWISWRVIQFTSAAEHATSMWNMPAIGDLDKAVDRLPYIQMVAGVCGLISVMAILGGIGAVGRALGDDDLGRRSRGLMIAVVILAVGYGLIIKWLTSGHPSNAALPLMLMLAIFALFVLFAYLGILRTAGDAMRAGPKPPEARVVDPAEKR